MNKTQKSKLKSQNYCNFSPPAGGSKYIEKNEGFTLIELMVGIAILAILSTLGMMYYGSTLKSARNTKRAEDLESIAKVIEVYKSNVGRYPISANYICLKDVGPTPPIVPQYMRSIPEDPSQSPDNPFCYLYKSDGNDYKLATHPLLFEKGELTTQELAARPNLADGESPSKSWAIYTTRAKGGDWSLGGSTVIAPAPTSSPGGGTPGCVSDGSCNAPTPNCGQLTTGVDNCNRPCSKTGAACPTSTPTPTSAPTAAPTSTPIVIPNCNTSISCSGSCTAPANTCGSSNGTRSGCNYTLHTSGSNCTQAAAPNQTCGISNCSSGYSCVSGVCQSNDRDNDGVANSSDCAPDDASKWVYRTGYTDQDGDGYGAGSAQSVCSGATLAGGYVSSGTDCYDSNANARPGQTSYFTSQRGDGSFDYNCSGSIEPHTSNKLTTLVVCNTDWCAGDQRKCVGSSQVAVSVPADCGTARPADIGYAPGDVRHQNSCGWEYLGWEGWLGCK